jgi:hypothetical protein
MVKTCGPNLPTGNVGSVALTLPTTQRNSRHDDAADKLANDLKKALENGLNNSLNDA